MDQTTLAEKADTTRHWISHLEAGKPTVPMNMVLRVLGKLDLEIDLQVASATDPKALSEAPEIEAIDIDAIVSNAKSN